MSIPGSFEDASGYPRVYRASGGWLATLVVCGLTLAGGGIAGDLVLRHGTPSKFPVALVARGSLPGFCGPWHLLFAFDSAIENSAFPGSDPSRTIEPYGGAGP